MPDRPETTRGVGRIVARVERTGGRARVFSIGMLQDADEQGRDRGVLGRALRRLAEFEAEAFSVEVRPTDEDLALAPWRLRLSAVGVPTAH